MEKFRCVVEENVNITSMNRILWTKYKAVAAYDYFGRSSPKRSVQNDGIQTRRLNLELVIFLKNNLYALLLTFLLFLPSVRIFQISFSLFRKHQTTALSACMIKNRKRK